MISIMIIVGFNRAMDSYITAANNLHKDYHVENGQFRIYGSLTKKQELSMERRFHITIEENKNVDYELDDTHTLRIICADKEMNQVAIISGAPLSSEQEVILDPKFAAENHYEIGDEIILYDNTFHIVGYGISPDYVNTLKNLSDFLSSPQTFGVAYLTASGFEKIDNTDTKTTLYSYQGDSYNISRLRDYLDDRTQLLDFREKDSNSRIQAVFDDANGPKQMSVIIGVLLVIIVAFIISISIRSTIRAESQTIGILYAQGFNKNELMRYYIMLPSLLVLIGSLLGYGVGMVISRPLLFIEEAQYSLPYVELIDSWYLIAVGMVLPMGIALLITTLSLSQALNKTPLSLLNGNHSNNKVSKIEKIFTFKSFNFFTKFRLKDIVRERGSVIALLFGVLLSMAILCTAAYTRDSCYKYVADLEKNVPFTYVYTFIDQKDLNKYSKKGEQTALRNIKIDVKGSKKSLMIQGITPHSQFFKIPGIHSLKNNEVLVAPCLITKFGLRIGDRLTLIDDVENKTYNVMIKGISSYDYGQYLYTNIKTYNHIFNIHKQSYNALVTNQPIDIAEEKVSSTMNKSEMINGIKNLLTMVNIMADILLIGAVGILMTVVYMLMRMIIDKAKINISMVKIFGFTPDEVSKMYLKGNFVILIAGFIFALPAGYMITKMLYDSIMANMQQYILPYIKLSSILGAFIIMSLSYMGTCALLKRNLDHVLLTEALKNRE
ncbi:MAG: transporter permease [Clostridia bacterium]|jgi:putative ABC transport system permease protein|nr:transporter permease [Clostridia bacterium]